MEIAKLIRGRGEVTRLAHKVFINLRYQEIDGSKPSPVNHLLNEVTNIKLKLKAG